MSSAQLTNPTHIHPIGLFIAKFFSNGRWALDENALLQIRAKLEAIQDLQEHFVAGTTITLFAMSMEAQGFVEEAERLERVLLDQRGRYEPVRESQRGRIQDRAEFLASRCEKLTSQTVIKRAPQFGRQPSGTTLKDLMPNPLTRPSAETHRARLQAQKKALGR